MQLCLIFASSITHPKLFSVATTQVNSTTEVSKTEISKNSKYINRKTETEKKTVFTAAEFKYKLINLQPRDTK